MQNPPQTYYLIYRSEASGLQDEEALLHLLNQSRKRNSGLDITGMLVFFDNKFLQLLEGYEKDVKDLYADIRNDLRHKNVVTLREGLANDRLFPTWSMSFRVASPEEVAAEPAYKDIYKPGSAGALDLVTFFNLLRGKVREKQD